ncbi:MAG: hypothetical protein J1F07_09740 [Muribaculaceae bacterium]|nr:hypothetical protein [Muribaculaceae bacterium]
MRKLLLTLVAMMMTAFAININAETTTVYVVGAGDGLNWDLPGKAYTGEDGVVTFTVNNLTKFKVSKNNATAWDGDGSYNAGAYGPGNTTFGSSVYPNGQTLSIEPWGEDIDLPWTGNYTITVNFNTNQMTAKTSTPQPTNAPAVYIRGGMNGWAGTPADWQFTNVSWTGTAGEWTFTGTIPAGQEFKIADSSWGAVNYTLNNTNLTPTLDSPYNAVYNGGNTKLATAFTGTVTLKITNYSGHVATITFSQGGGGTVTPSYPKALYIIGTINGGAWAVDNTAPMTSNDEGVYTINSVTLGENGGSCGFAITGGGASWNDVNTLRFGPSVKDTKAVVGSNKVDGMGDVSWTIDPGTYKMVFNYDDMTLEISAVSPVEPEPDPDPEVGDNIDVTFDFESFADIQKYNSSIPNVGGAGWQASSSSSSYALTSTLFANGGVDLTVASNAGATKATITNYSTTEFDLRLSPANSITITVPVGYIIDEIVFSGSSSNMFINKLSLPSDGVGVLENNSTAKTMTWSPNGAQTNKVVVGHTQATGTTRIANIVVKAHKVDGSDTPTVPETTWNVMGSYNDDSSWSTPIKFASEKDGVYYTDPIAKLVEFKLTNDGTWYGYDGQGYATLGTSFKIAAGDQYGNVSFGLSGYVENAVIAFNPTTLQVTVTGTWVSTALELYLQGAMNDWKAVADYKLATEDGVTYTLTLPTIEAGVEFKIAAANWSPEYTTNNTAMENGEYAITGGNNMALGKTLNNVTLTLNLSTNKLTIAGTESGATTLYLYGNFNEWAKVSEWTFATEDGENYTLANVNIPAESQMKISDGSWNADNTYSYTDGNIEANTKYTLVNLTGDNENMYVATAIDNATVNYNKNTHEFEIVADVKAPTVPEAWYFYSEADWGKGTAMELQDGTTEKGEYIYTLKLDELKADLSFKIFPNAEGQGEPGYGPGSEGGEFNGTDVTLEAVKGAGGNFVNKMALTDVTLNFFYLPEGQCWLQVQGTGEIEEPAPQKVYVVGNGTGMTWDLPGQAYDVVNGVATFNLTGVDAFKVSTVNTTVWDDFDAAALATGNTEFGDAVGTAPGQTLPVEIWGDNQKLPWNGDYTITLDIVNKTMTAYTTTPKPVNAPDVYIRGDMNNWLNGGLADEWKLTNVSYDQAAQTGTWTWTGKISAGQSFKFADGTWGSVNFGGASGIKANETVNLSYNGSNMTLAADFDGTLTFTITQKSSTATALFEMEGEAPAPEKMWVIGTINGDAWNPQNVAEMTTVSEGIYTIQNVTLGEDNGNCGFALTAGQATSASDWTSVNALRFAPAESDTPVQLGGVENAVTVGDRSWTIPAGSYNMTFDYKNMTLKVEVYEAPELGDEIDAQYNFTNTDAVYAMNPEIPVYTSWENRSSAYWYYINEVPLMVDGVTITAYNGTASTNNRPAIRRGQTGTQSQNLRFNAGSTMTVKAPEGMTLESITFEGIVAVVTLAEGQPGQVTYTNNSVATWTPSEVMTLAAGNGNSINEVQFIAQNNQSTSLGQIQTITVKASKVETSEPEPTVDAAIEFDSPIAMNFVPGVTTDVEVPVDFKFVTTESDFEYAGFQYDITLPDWVSVDMDNAKFSTAYSADSQISIGQPQSIQTNTYRVIVKLQTGTVSDVLNAICTLPLVASNYTNVAAGEYPVSISRAFLSNKLGDEFVIDGFDGFIKVEWFSNPVVSAEIKSVTVAEPSYSGETMIDDITAGETLDVTLDVTLEDPQKEATDEFNWSSNVPGVEFTYNEATGELQVDTSGVDVKAEQSVEVTITGVANDGVKVEYTFTLRGLWLGDSNNNQMVTVADVVTTANIIATEPVTRFDFPNANVITNPGENGEQVINTDDLTATVNIALDNGKFDGNRNPQTVRRQTRQVLSTDRLVADNYSVRNANEFAIAVQLENTYNYAALQAVVEVPAGMTVKNVTTGPRTAGHDLVYKVLDNGNVNVVIYSKSNAQFIETEGALFNLIVTADAECGALSIDKIHASDALSNGYDLSFAGGLNTSLATGVEGLEDADNANVRYFTVDGVEVVNPEAGQILIRVEGDKAEKVVVK